MAAAVHLRVCVAYTHVTPVTVTRFACLCRVFHTVRVCTATAHRARKSAPFIFCALRCALFFARAARARRARRARAGLRVVSAHERDTRLNRARFGLIVLRYKI